VKTNRQIKREDRAKQKEQRRFHRLRAEVVKQEKPQKRSHRESLEDEMRRRGLIR